MTQTTPTLVLLSGGLDSTVLLTELARTRVRVEALTIFYGQRHVIEIEASANVANHLGIRHEVLDLNVLQNHLRSALVGTANGPIPHGHYAAANMAETVVPNRNAIMLNVAAGVAASRNLEQVATAVHSGDHTIYADCRPEFIAAANAAVQLGTDGAVHVDAPYLRLTKAQVVTRGQACSAPMELSWSCYEGNEAGDGSHCGRCGTCVERAEAFHQARVLDPTYYRDAEFWRTQVGVA
jgi:7-cyano-7-deazaguanine synthase